MRELKFRAWNGEKMRGIEKNDFFSIRSDGMVSMNLPSQYEPKLMQYTGLKDSHGVDIYEADVVCIAGYGEYIVEFPFIELYDAAPENDIGNIIGNIYENPELLEEVT